MVVKHQHPTAIVESEDIGDGTRIWHFAHIREGAKIGRNCNIGKGVYIDAGVAMGDDVTVQNFVSIYNGVTIEDDVFIGQSVTFTNGPYPRAFIRNEGGASHTKVERGVSIGANSTIVGRVTIGEYTMIGAGSVVTRDVVPFGLVYGNPAKLKGFVCYCGNKLKTVVGARAEGGVYGGSCGTTVGIEKELLAWTM